MSGGKNVEDSNGNPDSKKGLTTNLQTQKPLSRLIPKSQSAKSNSEPKGDAALPRARNNASANAESPKYIPRYLQPPAASCHDLCKHGIKSSSSQTIHTPLHKHSPRLHSSPLKSIKHSPSNNVSKARKTVPSPARKSSESSSSLQNQNQNVSKALQYQVRTRGSVPGASASGRSPKPVPKPRPRSSSVDSATRVLKSASRYSTGSPSYSKERNEIWASNSPRRTSISPKARFSTGTAKALFTSPKPDQSPAGTPKSKIPHTPFQSSGAAKALFTSPQPDQGTARTPKTKTSQMPLQSKLQTTIETSSDGSLDQNSNQIMPFSEVDSAISLSQEGSEDAVLHSGLVYSESTGESSVQQPHEIDDFDSGHLDSPYYSSSEDPENGQSDAVDVPATKSKFRRGKVLPVEESEGQMLEKKKFRKGRGIVQASETAEAEAANVMLRHQDAQGRKTAEEGSEDAVLHNGLDYGESTGESSVQQPHELDDFDSGHLDSPYYSSSEDPENGQSDAVDVHAMKSKFRRGKVLPVEESEGQMLEKKKFRKGRGIVQASEAAQAEAANVMLRHQDVQGRKTAEDFLLNPLIEETVQKLVPTKKSKVKAIVGAFETVISLKEKETEPNTMKPFESKAFSS